MRPSIRVSPKEKKAKMDPKSRLNYAKIYTIEHNVKVKPYGVVHHHFIHLLVHTFNAQWNIMPPSAASGESSSSDEQERGETVQVEEGKAEEVEG
jgi:hypothetical protein